MAHLLILVATLSGCADATYDDTSAALADETVTLIAPRLGFTSTIDARTLGAEPDPLIAGASLYDIVSSRVVVREDGKACSACHYAGSEAAYRPEIAEGSDRAILPIEVVDGRTWAGPDGWAARFIAHDDAHETEKPAYLRAAFAKWLDDGCHTRSGVTWNLPLTFEALGGEPDPRVVGKSLKDIVSSRVSGRPDDKLCAACHHEGGEIAYRPPVDDTLGDVILAGTIVDGRAWRGDDGWARRFIGLHDGEDAKPAYLRALFQLWLDDGGL